jgi:hypothetical protein
VYTLKPRYNHAPDSYEIGLSTQFRTLKFTGSTPNSLLLFNDSQAANCLWVLDPEDDDNPYLSDLTRAFLPSPILTASSPCLYLATRLKICLALSRSIPGAITSKRLTWPAS